MIPHTNHHGIHPGPSHGGPTAVPWSTTTTNAHSYGHAHGHGALDQDMAMTAPLDNHNNAFTLPSCISNASGSTRSSRQSSQVPIPSSSQRKPQHQIKRVRFALEAPATYICYYYHEYFSNRDYYDRKSSNIHMYDDEHEDDDDNASYKSQLWYSKADISQMSDDAHSSLKEYTRNCDKNYVYHLCQVWSSPCLDHPHVCHALVQPLWASEHVADAASNTTARGLETMALSARMKQRRQVLAQKIGQLQHEHQQQERVRRIRLLERQQKQEQLEQDDRVFFLDEEEEDDDHNTTMEMDDDDDDNNSDHYDERLRHECQALSQTAVRFARAMAMGDAMTAKDYYFGHLIQEEYIHAMG